jgi:hypothetical protein
VGNAVEKLENRRHIGLENGSWEQN